MKLEEKIVLIGLTMLMINSIILFMLTLFGEQFEILIFFMIICVFGFGIMVFSNVIANHLEKG